MTHLLDKLIELDMVERQAGTEDRRTINISLTNTGKTAFEKNTRLVKKAIGDTLSALADEDLKELSVTFKKLKKILFKLEITQTPGR